MTPRSKCPKLAELAHHCWEIGPVNLNGVVLGLVEGLKELPNHERRDHPCVAMIIGHLAHMTRTAIGPSDENVAAYLDWLKQQDVLEKYNLIPKPPEMALAA